MDIFKSLTEIVGSAKKTLSEKSKNTALVSRLRTTIKTEERNCDRAYIALGKYYYHNLRDKNDLVCEPHCEQLDASRKIIEKTALKLDAIYNNSEIEKEEEAETEAIADEVTPEPPVKAYVYLNDEFEDDKLSFTPEEHIVDESVEQHVTLNDTESEDEKNLNFD